MVLRTGLLKSFLRAAGAWITVSNFLNIALPVVREYWIVDPEKSRIMVHDLINEDITESTFHDCVKAGIYENLMIDFSKFNL